MNDIFIVGHIAFSRCLVGLAECLSDHWLYLGFQLTSFSGTGTVPNDKYDLFELRGGEIAFP